MELFNQVGRGEGGEDIFEDFLKSWDMGYLYVILLQIILQIHSPPPLATSRYKRVISSTRKMLQSSNHLKTSLTSLIPVLISSQKLQTRNYIGSGKIILLWSDQKHQKVKQKQTLKYFQAKGRNIHIRKEWVRRQT